MLAVRRLQKAWLALFLALALAVVPVRSARGMAVANLLTGISSEITQLLNFASLITQIIQLYQQAVQIYHQLQTMYTNLKKLGSMDWSNPIKDLMAIRSVLQQGARIAYSAAALEGQFTNKYKGYSNYVMNHLGGQTLLNKFQEWSDTNRDNAMVVAEAMDLSQEQRSDENALVEAIQEKVTNADGQQEVLQASAELMEMQIDQLQKLRELLELQMKMQTAYHSTEVDKADVDTANRAQIAPPDQLAPPDDDGDEF